MATPLPFCPVDALTLFAQVAPLPIPDWFDVVPVEVPIVTFATVFGDAPLPVSDAIARDRIERSIVDWMRDDAGSDLFAFVDDSTRSRMSEDEFVWIETAQRKVEAANRARYEAIRENATAREIGWRWFWAKRMVEGRSTYAPVEPEEPPLPDPLVYAEQWERWESTPTKQSMEAAKTFRALGYTVDYQDRQIWHFWEPGTTHYSTVSGGWLVLEASKKAGSS